MSTKHVRTIEDLARLNRALKVECSHCHSARTLSASAAVKGLGLVPLQGVARRFRCLRCGMKQAQIVVLPPVQAVRLGANVPQLDAVYEHGLAWARSQAFYDQYLFWQWMRMPGDVVFSAGTLLMGWDFLIKLRQPRGDRDQPLPRAELAAAE